MALKRRGAAASSRRTGTTLGKLGEEAATRKRGKEWLSIGEGETAIMRVLPDTFEEVYVHRTPIDVEQEVKVKGKTKTKVVTKHYDQACLDQDEDGTPCPGCADDVERRYKFYVWTIVRDVEPEGGGKAADKLMLWSGGVKLFKELNKKHKSRGLQNRDIEVSREGTGFDTEYEVEWSDEENVPMSANDKKLAEKVESLDYYTTPPDFDEFYTPPSERERDDDDKDVGEKSLRRGSPLAKRSGGSTKKSTGTAKTGLAKLKATKESGSARTKSTGTKKIIKRK